MRYVKYIPFAVFLPAALFLPVLLFAAGCNPDSNKQPQAPASEAASAPESGETIRLGAEAPEFSLPDLNGKQVSLKQYRGGSVLLNFWATWCVPCVAEMAALQRLSQLLKDRSFIVVGVNVDDSAHDAEVAAFVRDKGLTFPILRDTEMRIPELFKLSGFPETFLIGPQGKFLSVHDEDGNKKDTIRVVGDRPWDAQIYVRAVEAALEQANKK